MNTKFRNIFLGLSLLCILAGLVLIIWPRQAAKALCIALGCILVLLGLMRMMRCWKGDSLGQLDGGAAGGMLMLIAGMLTMIRSDVIMAMIIPLLGLGLAVDGFVKLQLAFSIKRLGSSAWKRDAIAAIVIMAIGVFLLFDPFAGKKAMPIVTGVILILNGLINGWMYIEQGRAAKQPAQPQVQQPPAALK